MQLLWFHTGWGGGKGGEGGGRRDIQYSPPSLSFSPPLDFGDIICLFICLEMQLQNT